MHMKLSSMKALKKQTIDMLEIVSMEGRYYMARFYVGGHGYVLTDEEDRVMMFSGACAARDAFHGMSVTKTEVIPPTGTDEMIGMPVTTSESMRVPL
ncbi:MULTISPECIES: DUF6482 family protein [Marinobacter]|uniref:DUF6482 family protein n=1 Tax=Marinobacter suaedae TaxID=3057675 RepID=A0ABT8VZG5_9GAMM|nr:MULTISPECIES: DUF6482 family protein [unclassified Marinobacter]MBZ2169559.1 DUF6482 family protein [Marinobacter sp. F4216]MDO3721392.1 DUF6482 family protein [Marinobacter sp. chi1]